MRRLLPLIVLLLIGPLLLAGCNPSSFVVQRYNNFTAYYNTFYNAQEAFESGVASIESYDEPVDRGQYLPVFVPPDRVGGGQDFDRAIRKCADVLRDHPNSKWVDDALLLIGKSYFYKQNYVGAAQKFREAITIESSVEREARFWLARALIESGEYQSATEHLQSSLDDGVDDTWAAMMQLALGALHVRQQQWQEAAVALAQGLQGTPDDRAAARAAFLLGQVRETMGAYNAAARAFEVVNEEYRPSYELAFAARVSAIRIRGLHDDADEALRRLHHLERDDKYFEKRAELTLLRGQLYQAMGRSEAARHIYRTLLYDDDPAGGAGTRGIQGQVHYALGTLYQKAYSDFSAAAAHFDTAATSLDRPAGLSSESMGYAPAAITDSRAQANLYQNLAARSALVSRLDSLLHLGTLSEPEFENAVAALRERRAQEEAQQRRAAARQEAAQRFSGEGARAQRDATQQQTTTETDPGGAGFLFHRDPVRAQEVRRSFERRWGERPLVPNWRRSEAIRAQREAPEESTEVADPVASEMTAETAANPAARAAGIDVSAVPRDSASQEAMRARRAVARYELANALFLAAGRPDSAAVWYQQVVDEDNEHPVAQRALYALAEVRQAQDDTAAARRIYQRIVERYPGSVFAQRAQEQLGQRTVGATAVADSVARAEAAYERAYATWEADGTNDALQQFIDVAVAYGETPVAAKALWAAVTVFLEREADRPRTLDMLLPSPFESVVERSDSPATLQVSRFVVPSLFSSAPTLGMVLDHIASQYPDTPHAQRAEQLRATLAARASTEAADSTRVDSTDSDSAAADSVIADTAVSDTPRADAEDTAAAREAEQEDVSGWFILIASRDQEAVAERLQQVYAPRIQFEGISVRVRPVEEDETTRYQITAGPFASEDAAVDVMEQLRNQLPGQARVVQVP